MPQVTAIKKQKRGSRANIFLDGKFAFGIDLDNLVKFNIKVEQNLTKKEVKKIVEEANLQKNFALLVKYAMSRPRSEKEITDWFRKRKVHESIQKKLVKKIKKLDLLDDKKFATWWVEQRLTFRPKGKRALQQELYIKGISKQIISEVLEDTEIDESKLAKQLVEKNSYKWERLDEAKRKQKIIGFLQRKGFGWDVIKEVL